MSFLRPWVLDEMSLDHVGEGEMLATVTVKQNKSVLSLLFLIGIKTHYRQ